MVLFLYYQVPCVCMTVVTQIFFSYLALLDILDGSWFDNFVINCRYVVDAADRDSVPIAKSELHDLLTKQSLAGIPLLVLGNKIDKSEALSKQALVDQLWAQSSSFAYSSFYFLHDISAEALFLPFFVFSGLELIKDREVCCYMISCKDSVNIDVVIDWLIKHSRTAK